MSSAAAQQRASAENSENRVTPGLYATTESHYQCIITRGIGAPRLSVSKSPGPGSRLAPEYCPGTGVLQCGLVAGLRPALSADSSALNFRSADDYVLLCSMCCVVFVTLASWQALA